MSPKGRKLGLTVALRPRETEVQSRHPRPAEALPGTLQRRPGRGGSRGEGRAASRSLSGRLPRESDGTRRKRRGSSRLAAALPGGGGTRGQAQCPGRARRLGAEAGSAGPGRGAAAGADTATRRARSGGGSRGAGGESVPPGSPGSPGTHSPRRAGGWGARG